MHDDIRIETWRAAFDKDGRIRALFASDALLPFDEDVQVRIDDLGIPHVIGVPYRPKKKVKKWKWAYRPGLYDGPIDAQITDNYYTDTQVACSTWGKGAVKLPWMEIEVEE